MTGSLLYIQETCCLQWTDLKSQLQHTLQKDEASKKGNRNPEKSSTPEILSERAVLMNVRYFREAQNKSENVAMR